MKTLLTLITILIFTFAYSQEKKISTVDFVQIVNENSTEAIYYYENNWKVLRKMAVEKKLIESFQLLQTDYSQEAPFHLIMITTYSNQNQYDSREDNFAQLIKERGSIKLLNDKKPNDFRKNIFSKEQVHHLE